VPTLKVLPLTEDTLRLLTPQLSVALTAPKVTAAEQAVADVCVTTLLGQTSDGVVVSTTVTVNVHEA